MYYIIGIGTNIGFNIENIQIAISNISKHKDINIIKKASLYSSQAVLKKNAPKKWDIIFLNTAIKIVTSIKPLSLLIILKDIEKKIGRDSDTNIWSPRIIDLDILAAENLILNLDKLTIPHKELLNRSFALLPLLELTNNWHHPSINIDLNIKARELGHIIKLKQNLTNTMRMGIVNLSKESFSDSFFTDTKRKLNFHELIINGAEIIDIGAESTKPNANPITIETEINILDNFLKYIKIQFKNLIYRPLISIDTRKLEVMEQILIKHNDIIWMINDVECNNIEQKAKLIFNYQKKYVITHNLGIINRNKYIDKFNAIDIICKYINKKKQILLNNGVLQKNIFFDIGFGFGKNTDTAIYLLDNLINIKQKVGLKVLVGHSRKASILGIDKNSDLQTLDLATNKLSRKLESLNIDIIRVHKIQ